MGAIAIEHRVTKRDIPLIASFLLPGLIIFAFVIIFPTFLAIDYSFYQANSFAGDAVYVGMQNYVDVFLDPRFWRDLMKTIVYSGATVALQMAVGIAIALVLNQKFAGNNVLRGISVVPYIIPVIVVTIGWEWMLDTDTGIINHLIASLGLGKIKFLSTNMAMWTSVMLSTWTWTPFVTLVFLSGLQTISHEVYESAMLDGARKWTQFWRITVPMLKDIIITIVLLRGLWMFNKFDLNWLLTGGGPLEKTETLPILIYLNTFKQFKVGYGSTIAVISFFIMFLAMLVYLRIFRENQAKRKYLRRKSRNAEKGVALE
ncbi:carbohydrate ABC transporter permease [Gordoniibacillus kamchatkensis]|uniref:carbohydrate ABC transporter permease n=1 Tax=Gordoniibacillus kamchatkensis TaxID=1590651 RepID=UPI000698C80D|nr:sugar ABC transporter permease [Paenibacillus sp. VKM B-2647]